LAWIVFLALLVVPVAEIAVIIGVGKVIGGWQALQTALSTGKMPGRELADAALVLIGGTLLLTPGFLTDLVGFFFILPITRPITRQWLQRLVERRLTQPPPGVIRGEVI